MVTLRKLGEAIFDRYKQSFECLSDGADGLGWFLVAPFATLSECVLCCVPGKTFNQVFRFGQAEALYEGVVFRPEGVSVPARCATLGPCRVVG